MTQKAIHNKLSEKGTYFFYTKSFLGFRLSINFMALFCILPFAGKGNAPAMIIKDGNRVKDNFLYTGSVKNSEQGVVLTKQNNAIYYSEAVKAGKFQVDATLMLEKLAGTGAAFIFDRNKLFFDCPKSSFCPKNASLGFWGRELIGNGIDGYYGIKSLGLAKKYIAPGKFFSFKMNCDGKVLKFYINDKLIGKAEYTNKISHTFGFTGHNGVLSVKDFSVKGVPDGDAVLFNPAWVRGVRFNIPVVEYPLSINKDHLLLLEKQHDTPPGVYQAELRPENSEISVKFELKISRITSRTPRHGKSISLMARFFASAKIPQTVLKKAFKLSQCEFSAKPFVLSLSGSGRKNVLKQSLILYDPNGNTDFPNCKIQKYNETPSLVVNRKPLGTMPARLSWLVRAKRFSAGSVKDFANVGINVNILTVRPSLFYKNGKFDIEANLKYIDTLICRTVACAPKALICFDWQLYMSKEWCDKHPGEMIALENGLKKLKYAPGQILQPSYASELWRKDAGNVLKILLERLRKSQWADRIIMVRSSYANAGEWNNWGYKSFQFVDFSRPMQRAFGKWLEKKYKNVENLRKAWGNENVSFDSENLVPGSKQRFVADDSILFYIDKKNQAAIDYYTFFQWFAVNTIEYFAKIVKNSSGKRILSGAYYGYYLGHINHIPYHLQESGHYGLKYYLRSKYLDFLGGPYPYYDRKGRLQINSLYSSIAFHNKVWLSENDQRTHLSDKRIQARYGATDNLAESVEIAKRDYMLNFSKGTSYYFFDFIKDWFITPEYMKAIRKLKVLDKINFEVKGKRSHAEVAILFSEAMVPYYANHPVTRDNSLRLLLCAQRNLFETELDRTGVPWDLYAVSDMELIDFSRYKLVLFVNADFVSDKTIELTHKRLFDKGKTVLFIGSPGIIGTHKLDYTRSGQFTGINIVPFNGQQKFSQVKSESYPGLDFDLKKLPFSKSYWVKDDFSITSLIEDKQASPLAYYGNSNYPAMAEKKVSAGRSILLTSLAPPKAEVLRTIFKRVGIHVYLDKANPEDSFYCAGNLLAVYSRQGGEKDISLPGKVETVMDVFSGKVLASGTNRVKLNLPEKIPEARIIFAGPKKIAQRYKKVSSIK